MYTALKQKNSFSRNSLVNMNKFTVFCRFFHIHLRNWLKTKSSFLWSDTSSRKQKPTKHTSTTKNDQWNVFFTQSLSSYLRFPEFSCCPKWGKSLKQLYIVRNQFLPFWSQKLQWFSTMTNWFYWFGMKNVSIPGTIV